MATLAVARWPSNQEPSDDSMEDSTEVSKSTMGRAPHSGREHLVPALTGCHRDGMMTKEGSKTLMRPISFVPVSPAVATLAILFSALWAFPQQLTPPEVSFALGQNVDLVVQQSGRLRGTDMAVTLVEARGPRAGCFDCPLRARLTVRSGGETADLIYSFSGNMVPELLAKAKRKTAFGRVFLAVRVGDAGLTLRVNDEAPKQP